MLALWGGFYSEWELGDKVTFDAVNRLILVNPGVTSIDIKQDVYSAWKRWKRAELSNAAVEPAMRTVGGDPTTNAQRLGDTYFLINNWKLVLNFATTGATGILYSDDYATPYWDADDNPLFPAEVTSIVNTIEVPTNVVDPNALDGLATTAEVAAVETKVDGVRAVVDTTDGKVDAVDTKVDAVPTNVWNYTQ